MPASQLKRLKASLREQGITGQQKANKAKKRNGPTSRAGDQRAMRDAALAQIRDNFNPFEVKAPTRPSKFDITTNRTGSRNGSGGNGALGRPAVTKSHGEQTRRRTLLPELQRRNKVGGILDRRIGENDPNMTPQERAEMRFVRASGGRMSMGAFDLEDDAEDMLTHGGRSLADDAGDDFDEQISQASSDLDDEGLGLKRKRPTAEQLAVAIDDDAAEQPERKRSKAEVMKEVIAKSKLHKYERQQAKEDDDDLREELDRGMGDLMAALRGQTAPKPVPPRAIDVEASINPDRLALLNGADRTLLEKDYDTRIRQMTLDKRAQPTERTKTEEEKAQEEASKLRSLEEDRTKRMKGEPVSDEEGMDEPEYTYNPDDMVEADDAVAFGLKLPPGQPALGIEDEDDFIIDNDLVASDSDIGEDENSAAEAGSEMDVDAEEDQFVEDNDELISGLLTHEERDALQKRQTEGLANQEERSKRTYMDACPRSHEELISVLDGVSVTDLPLAIQRIRMLYNPKAAMENKARLADFAAALVSHVVHLGDAKPETPLPIIETVIRHVHSLSRTFADSISAAFQKELRALAEGDLTQGRLCLLTAVGTVYPTSDHFHQVVTPAITIMARWLCLTTPKTSQDLATGAYLIALCIGYQQLSKRYIPELLRFISHALVQPQCPPDLLAAHLANFSAVVDLWASKSAFTEIFSGFLDSLQRCKHQSAPAVLRKLNIILQQTRQSRHPLELHHHRSLPIKTAVPLFEDNFNPDKHYDPNFARSEANKLKSEYKRERKGALRELRKDANFVARERLREKRERDRLHEERERRIVAEINAEGGQERNEYEREKKRRKGR